MKEMIQARLNKEDQSLLKELEVTTGQSVSSLIKEGLRLVYEKEVKGTQSALDVAQTHVGRLTAPFTDLSLHKKHLKGYGK